MPTFLVPGRAVNSLPAGITVEGATPLKGSVYRAPLCAPVNARRCRTSGKKRGVAPSTSTPLVRRAAAPGEGGRARRSLASLCRIGRGKCSLFRVLCRVSGKCQTTTARGAL